MQVFVVEMLRWGERELHSYVAGIYYTIEDALAAALDAEEDRGGKYEAEIASFTVGQGRRGIEFIKRSERKWWDEIPDERKLQVGDRVKNIEGAEGTVVEVTQETLGQQSVLVNYTEDEKWHSTENLEKL